MFHVRRLITQVNLSFSEGEPFKYLYSTTKSQAYSSNKISNQQINNLNQTKSSLPGSKTLILSDSCVKVS